MTITMSKTQFIIIVLSAVAIIFLTLIKDNSTQVNISLASSELENKLIANLKENSNNSNSTDTLRDFIIAKKLDK